MASYADSTTFSAGEDGIFESGAPSLGVGQPVVASVRLNPAVKRMLLALKRGGKLPGEVALEVRFMPLAHTRISAVRVFLDLPEANGETALDDPHYIGSFAFFPLSSDPSSEHPAFIVDATEALRRDARWVQPAGQDTVTVTLVALPPRSSSDAIPLQIESLALRARP